MKRFAFITLLGIFAACGNNEPQVIDASEIMPKSKRDYDVKPESKETVDTTIIALSMFQTNGVAADNLMFSKKKMFPDRLSPKSVQKFDVTEGENPFSYYNWTFKDSTKVMNTFYNWLDMLGVETLGESKALESDYLCVLVGDTNLIYISGASKNTGKTWLQFHEKLGYDANWNYMIEQPANRKAKWFTFADEKRVEFKLDDE